MAEVSRAPSEPQIAALVARSLTSFKALTSTLQDDHSRASQASSCLARFKLWAGNLGAHRPSGSRSLEYRLRDASNIRKLVISLLQDLCSSIEQGTIVANGGSIPDTTSEGHDAVEDDLADYFNEDSDSDKSEVEQTLDEIAHVVDCLLRLSVTIRNPAPHDQFLSRAGEDLVKESVKWDTEHVQHKFPNVENDLADRLGRAMARRRQYFKYREENKSRLAEGLDEEDGVDFGGRATTIASSLPEHLKEAGKSAEPGVTRFAILDDARSDTSATSYATSRGDSNQTRVPPIPKEHIDGSFKCPFCHMIVSIDTRHAWKKHVFRDLRPYVCLSEDCRTPDHLYQRRNDWKMHMRREHWKTWHCPFGCDAEFDSAKGFQNHVETAHEQNVSLEKIHTLEGLSSRADVTKANGQCPLCYDFQVGSEKQYEKHVGQHLEHLALFTLPKIGEDDSDDEGDEDTEEEELGDGDEDDEDDDEEDEEEALAMANLEEEAKKAAAGAEAKEAAAEAAQKKEVIEKETKASLEESNKTKQAPIKFKDAIGRKFALPFHLCTTWQGMEDLIKQAFANVEVLEPHVIEGHYDLIDPDGAIILPAVWEKVVQPDWTITMTMWPMDEMPPHDTRWSVYPPPVPREKDPEKIRLAAKIAEFKAIEEKLKAEEKQRELEAQIRKEAEDAFARRMQAMRDAQEKAKKEIEEARLEAEKAARERMEAERKAEGERSQEQAEAMAAAEEKARLRFEAEMKVAEMRRQAEAEARAKVEEEARLKFEAAAKAAAEAAEMQRKAEAEEKVRLRFEAERKAAEEIRKEEEDKEAYDRQVERTIAASEAAQKTFPPVPSNWDTDLED
ncbi:hypothetical protein CEP51_000020 [Fusarium floridanum]|uniref:C2H2-type domain-containing protein n=1 Tax=Fusarium floridanum TaxID=1325733 RepID=A0A428SPU9_9HYPO|nr:hypothetical protein CEP51_000020 [Fusarium floridanum]